MEAVIKTILVKLVERFFTVENIKKVSKVLIDKLIAVIEAYAQKDGKLTDLEKCLIEVIKETRG